MPIKRCFVIAIVVLLHQNAQAGEIFFWPAIFKVRAERNEDQALESRFSQLPSFGASYRFDRWIITVDSSRFESTSEDGNVSIETKYTDLAFWGGYSLFQGNMWDIYAVSGVGTYRQKVETTVASLSTSNASSDKALVGVGAEYLLRTPFYFSLIAGGKFNWTEDLDPQLSPEAYLKLGFGF